MRRVIAGNGKGPPNHITGLGETHFDWLHAAYKKAVEVDCEIRSFKVAYDKMMRRFGVPAYHMKK